MRAPFAWRRKSRSRITRKPDKCRDRFHLYGNPTTQASDRRRSSGSREPIPKKKWERREPAPVRKIGKFSERLRLRCNGFGFGKLRDDAELLHKAQSVPVDPAFCHLASTEAGDAYPGDGDLLPRWRNAAEIAFMRTPTGPTGNHSFAFGNRSEEHTSELQSLRHLVCRLLP